MQYKTVKQLSVRLPNMINYPEDLTSILCPVQKTAELIGSKWSILIIRELHSNSSRRFNEFLRSLKPISSRTLSLRLKELVEYEIIEKKIISTSPPHSEYSLTDKGKDLATLLSAMAEWSYKWHDNEK